MAKDYILKKQTILFSAFLLGWFVINLLSAVYTGLAHDEAYYWMYSKYLDWGYFDHPPAVAFIIWLGGLLFQDEIGVRIINVLLGTVSLAFLWSLCRRYGEDLLLFIMLISGIFIFHVYGFITVPDSPLLATSVFYFWALRKYLNAQKPAYVLLVAIAVAMMLYSKYHGFLILAFTLIASPQLFLRKSFWLIVLISIALFSPHIIWQVNNHFPTLEFHLVSRFSKPYEIFTTVNYLWGVVFITGPLLSFLLWYALIKVKINNSWERILKYNAVGFVLFFILVSFKGKVEPNWNSPVIIPLVILTYKYVLQLARLRKLTLVLGGISLGLVFLVRFYAASDRLYEQLGSWIPFRNEVHQWDKWAGQIAEAAGDHEVIFLNSYQRAAKFTFYTGKASSSYNSIHYRKNQYDIWDIQSQFLGKEVLLIQSTPSPNLKIINTTLGDFYGYSIPNYCNFKKLVQPNAKEPLLLNAGEAYTLGLEFKNSFSFPVDLQAGTNDFSKIELLYYRKNELFARDTVILGKSFLNPGESYIQNVNVTIPVEKGSYNLWVSVLNRVLPPEIDGNMFKLIVQ